MEEAQACTEHEASADQKVLLVFHNLNPLVIIAGSE